MRILHGIIYCILIYGLFLLGCSPEPEESILPVDNTAEAIAKVHQGYMIMVPKVVSLIKTHGLDTAGYNLYAANAIFQEALRLDRGNKKAHFGYAVTRALSVFTDPSIRKFRDMSKLLPIPPEVQSAVLAQTGFGWFGPGSYGNLKNKLISFLLPDFPIDLRKRYLPTDTSRVPGAFQSNVEEKIIPVFSDAIQHLQLIAQQQTIAIYITPQYIGEDMQDSICIDLTEIYFIMSMLKSISANASFLSAYNLDYDSRSQLGVIEAWQTYSAYMTLRTNGVQRLKESRTSYLGFISNLQTAMTNLHNELPHPGIDPIQLLPGYQTSFSTMLLSLDSSREMLGGPAQVYYDFNKDSVSEYVLMNFRNYFDNGLTNLKAKMPKYSVSTQMTTPGVFDAILVWNAGTFNSWVFPDPGFNGLFPGMSDGTFKQTFGIKAAGWKNFIRIKG